MISNLQLTYRIARAVERLYSYYELSGDERRELARTLGYVVLRFNKMESMLMRLKDEIEALDGTSLENEKIVAEYRQFFKQAGP
jgi:hypothetical protein